MTDIPPQFQLTVIKIVPAACERVFEAWLSPEALAVFIRPAPGVTIPRVDVDARVGGKFLIVMKVGSSDVPHHGEYRVIDRYSRLAFTWHSAQTAPHSLVTIDFEALGPEQTRVSLHHADFPNETIRSNHETGWTGILDALSELVGRF